MLAAGIQSPVPMEELEIHLREEIERQMKSGANQQHAFETAHAQIGQAEPIKAEFKKADGFLGWLGENKQSRINRCFALLWLAYCSWLFFSIAAVLAVIPFLSDFSKFRFTDDLYIILLYVFILIFGVIASIRLFGGNNKEIRTIRSIAILGLVAFVAQIIAFKTFSAMAVTLTVFNLASIYLLRSPKHQAAK